MQREAGITTMLPIEVRPVTDNGIWRRLSTLRREHTHNHVWQSDSTVRYIKAIAYQASLDGAISERIIGTAIYHVYECSHTASERNPWPRSPNEVPEGAHASVCLHYFQTLTKARLDYTKGEPHAFLANLVVDPNFQRRGVGTKLLDFIDFRHHCQIYR